MDFSKCSFLRSYGRGNQLEPSVRKEVVFAGRSNVGKSTLLNKLCNNNKLARVSSTPGKTATINFFTLSNDYYLVDLPGYGFSKKSDEEHRRWAELMESYFSSGRMIELVVFLLDARRVPNADDEQMAECLSAYEIPFVVVVTKTDKLNQKELSESLEMIRGFASEYGCEDVLSYSSMDQKSILLLREQINQRCG
jgi:GTP-binding protein